MTHPQTNRLLTYFAFLLVDSLYLCQFITCIFLNKGWGDLNVSQIIFRGHLFIQSIVELKSWTNNSIYSCYPEPWNSEKISGSGSGRKKRVRAGSGSGYPSGPAYDYHIIILWPLPWWIQIRTCLFQSRNRLVTEISTLTVTFGKKSCIKSK